MINQADIASRVGRSPSAMSHMRKHSPALYRAVVLGVTTEATAGIGDSHKLLQLHVVKTALPEINRLQYPNYEA